MNQCWVLLWFWGQTRYIYHITGGGQNLIDPPPPKLQPGKYKSQRTGKELMVLKSKNWQRTNGSFIKPLVLWGFWNIWSWLVTVLWFRSFPPNTLNWQVLWFWFFQYLEQAVLWKNQRTAHHGYEPGNTALMTAMVCSCPTVVSTKYQHVLYWRHCSISWTLLSSPLISSLLAPKPVGTWELLLFRNPY